MKFDLNARWAIETEENQVTIHRRQFVKEGDNKGKEYLQPSYYYNNMEQALLGFIDRDINGLEKAQDFAERITELKSEIKTMLKTAEKPLSHAPTIEIIPKECKDKGLQRGKRRKKAVKQRLSD